MSCYRSCHQKVMSLWWDAYNRVVPPISQSSAEPTAVGAPCYNRKHLELVWHAPTCQSHSLEESGAQWDRAAKCEGLVTLSGDVRGFSQVDDEPRGTSGERGRIRGREEMGERSRNGLGRMKARKGWGWSQKWNYRPLHSGCIIFSQIFIDFFNRYCSLKCNANVTVNITLLNL